MKTKHVCSYIPRILPLCALMLLFVACNPTKKAGEVVEDKIEVREEMEKPHTIPTDTVWAVSELIDSYLTDELDVALFNTLKANNITHTTKMVSNEHVQGASDTVYQFRTDKSNFDFLRVNNSGKIFLLQAYGEWNDKEVTVVQQAVEELLEKMNEKGDISLALAISNPENFTTLVLLYDDEGKLEQYAVDKWVD